MPVITRISSELYSVSLVCAVDPQGLEEQNWYVGSVGRVEAEHALHLVNRVNTHKHTHSYQLLMRTGNSEHKHLSVYGECVDTETLVRRKELFWCATALRTLPMSPWSSACFTTSGFSTSRSASARRSANTLWERDSEPTT